VADGLLGVQKSWLNLVKLNIVLRCIAMEAVNIPEAKTRRLFESADQVFVSAASLSEVAIKVRLGKIEADVDELAVAIEPSGLAEWLVRAACAAGLARLALHHNDPFDRLHLAQAIAEPLRLLTAETF
jgi:PIN domain nuclease of toxin-antitoxin system